MKIARKACPMTKKSFILQKPLDAIHDLITAKQSKCVYKDLRPLTVDRITNTLLTQMITGKSAPFAQQTLQMVGNILYQFSKELLQRNEPDRALKSFVDQNKKDHGRSIFSTSATTMNTCINRIRSKTADHSLSKVNSSIQTNLKKQGLWSKSTLLAVDPSHTLYYGKYVNRHINWGTVGQKPIYKRTYKEVAVYATTSQLITNASMEPILPSDKWKRSLPVWIQQVQKQILAFKNQGTTTKGIYGDREYYSSLGMAYSRLGLWDASCLVIQNPRLIVPKKIWGNRELTKWDYLKSPKSKIMTQDFIELDYYMQRFIGNHVHRLKKNRTKTRFHVPTWSYAIFDAYGNGKKVQSLQWGKLEALRIQKKLREAQHNLKIKEKDYVNYLRKQPNRKCASPSYKGTKRRIFKYNIDKTLYQACWKAKRRVKYWESKKTQLCKRLMFFSVSSRESDREQDIMEEIHHLVWGYHERWGVESAFKDVKYKFFLKTNSRKASGRHVRFIFSALVYNSWHYYRLLRIARVIKQKKKKWKPYGSHVIPKRKKYERDHGSVLQASRYIHQLLEISLKITMKRALAKM